MTAGAILLAAGQGKRFGSDKRRAAGAWQGSLLQHVVGLYRPCFCRLAVVIPAGDDFGQTVCREFAATALVNDQAALGMGRSLAVGIEWAVRQNVACAVIGLADMPWIAPETISRITREALQSDRPVVPSWQGQLGFPRAVPSACFAALALLDGDRGASAVIDWQAALWLACDDPGVIKDVDGPADRDGHQ